MMFLHEGGSERRVVAHHGVQRPAQLRLSLSVHGYHRRFSLSSAVSASWPALRRSPLRPGLVRSWRGSLSHRRLDLHCVRDACDVDVLVLNDRGLGYKGLEGDGECRQLQLRPSPTRARRPRLSMDRTMGLLRPLSAAAGGKKRTLCCRAELGPSPIAFLGTNGRDLRDVLIPCTFSLLGKHPQVATSRGRLFVAIASVDVGLLQSGLLELLLEVRVVGQRVTRGGVPVKVPHLLHPVVLLLELVARPWLAWAWMLRLAVPVGRRAAPVSEPRRHTTFSSAWRGYKHVCAPRLCCRGIRRATLQHCNGCGTMHGLRNERRREADRYKLPIRACHPGATSAGLGESRASHSQGPMRASFRST